MCRENCYTAVDTDLGLCIGPRLLILSCFFIRKICRLFSFIVLSFFVFCLADPFSVGFHCSTTTSVLSKYYISSKTFNRWKIYRYSIPNPTTLTTLRILIPPNKMCLVTTSYCRVCGCPNIRKLECRNNCGLWIDDSWGETSYCQKCHDEERKSFGAAPKTEIFASAPKTKKEHSQQSGLIDSRTLGSSGQGSEPKNPVSPNFSMPSLEKTVDVVSADGSSLEKDPPSSRQPESRTSSNLAGFLKRSFFTGGPKTSPSNFPKRSASSKESEPKRSASSSKLPGFVKRSFSTSGPKTSSSKPLGFPNRWLSRRRKAGVASQKNSSSTEELDPMRLLSPCPTES